MQRNLVQVARIRMQEVVPGDVVNRTPDDNRGWFIAAIVEKLFDGTLSVATFDRATSFAAGPLDVVGVQILKEIDIPVSETPPEPSEDALVSSDESDDADDEAVAPEPVSAAH